jgi:2-polyprenyl-3-methyl-5-hydroxy-6-metoxy-1,4-benzoquinol methylase
MIKKKFNNRYKFTGEFFYQKNNDLNIIYFNKFNSKFPKEKYWSELKCFICNEKNFEIISEIDRYGFYYPAGFCVDCGNVQQTEFLNKFALNEFYKNYFRKIYQSISPIKLFNFQKNNRSYDIFRFTNCGQKPKNVLDVGCGTGALLTSFLKNNCEVLGLDFNNKYLSVAKSKGINVRKGSIEQIKSNEKFDLIILSHVLEHLLNPSVFLKKIKNILSDNGILYIEVPSLEAILKGAYDYDLKKYLHNTHVCHYSLGSLELLCKKSGLKLIKNNDFIQSCWVKSSEDIFINEEDKKKNKTNNRILLNKIEKNRELLLTKIKLFFFKLRNTIVKFLEFYNLKSKIKYMYRLIKF